MKKLISLLGFTTYLLSAQLASAVNVGTLVEDNSKVNAYPDGVYFDSIIDSSETAHAAESSPDDVPLPDKNSMNTDTLYIGANAVFDTIDFDITTAGNSQRVCFTSSCQHYTAEYYDGSTKTWETLDYTDNTNNFETVGEGSWTFEVPEAWDASSTKATVNGQTLFWVRLTPAALTTITSPADAGEIALRSYNVELTLEDELGQALTGLVSEDFTVTGGTSNSVAGYRDRGNGLYEFALDAGLLDSNYELGVSQSGYVDESITTGVVSSLIKTLQGELQFSHKITTINNNTGAVITPDSVSVGSVSCTVSGSTAYCPLSTSEDGTAVSPESVVVSKSGYDSATKSLQADRDANTDAQVSTLVALTESAIPTVDPNDCETSFDDIYGHWAEDYITELYCRSVVKGLDSNTFGPSNNATRAEFLKMALLNAGYDVGGTSGEDFSDVSTGDWFYEYVSFGSKEGFIEGYSDGSFRPNEPINRAEALVITMRIAGVHEYSVSSKWNDFNDVDSNDWYAYAVETATDKGIVEGYGDGDFKPENDITRAEVAAISVRTYNEYYAD